MTRRRDADRSRVESQVRPLEPAAPLPAARWDAAALTALDHRSVLALQRSVGNAAVTTLMGCVHARGGEDNVRSDVAGAETPARPPAPGSLKRRLESPSGGVVLQRVPVATSGGRWEMTKYDLLKDVDPPTGAREEGMRGLDVNLVFTPNDAVDAKLIGLTQTAQSVTAGKPALLPSTQGRSIPASDAKAIGTGAGETDEGSHIDKPGGHNNPIFEVDSATSTSLADTTTRLTWGQEGWRYKDAAGKVLCQDATLIDQPCWPGAQRSSRQLFETTATATEGEQAGTYYGSVRWGWRTDDAGNFTKVALEKVSDGVPSSTFLKSAELWNPGKSRTSGAENVDLPSPDVKVTTRPVTLWPPGPQRGVALPAGTRLEILEGPLRLDSVKVVDGPYTGEVGQIDAADWSSIADERA